MSSSPSYTTRKAASVNAELPPRASRGARSRTSTLAPCSAAETAAHMAALPPPTTMTSITPSLTFQARVVGDLGPAAELAGDELRELLRAGGRLRLQPDAAQLLGDVRLLHDLRQRLVQAIEHGGGRLRGREQAHPVDGLEVAEA